jgi:CHAD domain-containing protein
MQPLDIYGRTKLSKRHRSLCKEAHDLSVLTQPELHKLRIQAKKLRYACEFFASLSNHPKRHKRFVKRLATTQDRVGEVNDVATTRQLVWDLVQADNASSKGLAFSPARSQRPASTTFRS